MDDTGLATTDKMVDLTDALEQYTRDADAEFFANLKKSDIMEMSFSYGEIIIVRVLEEDLSSTEDDIKYVVEILHVIDPVSDSPYHKVGQRRWVRAYDLKRCGTIGRG